MKRLTEQGNVFLLSIEDSVAELPLCISSYSSACSE